MPRKVDILLMLCLLLTHAIFAQESKKATLAVTDRGDGTYSLSFRLGEWRTFATNGDEYALYAEGMCTDCGTAGLPALPTASTLLSLPAGSTLAVEKHSATDAVWHSALPSGGQLRPTAGASSKDGEAVTIPVDPKLYTLDTTVQDGEPLSIEDLGTMGSHQLFRITVRPFAYNPAQGAISCINNIEATLKAMKTTPQLQTQERYLIVSRNEFRKGLQPFVRWKRQEGYCVEELYVDTNKRDTVKALVAPCFHPSAPKYMLLVGDAAQLQSFIGTTHPSGLDMHTTDLYYAEHTGDYLPDALLGRWPVNDTAELRVVVEKTLRYEQCIDLDTTHLKRVLLVAGQENSSPAPVTTNGQVNYVAREGKLSNPALDTIVYHNPASGSQREAILSDLQQGASMLNYTAHCTVSGWTTPSVSFTSIDTLDNNQPLLYVNNCCKSNDFSGTGFGEQLLRKPVGGAVGVIGATNSTLWNEDYYWAVGPKYPFSLEPEYDSSRLGAFDHLWRCPSDGISAGEIMAMGNMAVMAFGSAFSKFYWEIYCLLGDPSLKPYIGVPQPTAVTITEELLAGQTELALTVQEASCVSVMQGDSVLAIWRSNTLSDEPVQITLPLCQSLDTGLLTVTATAYMHSPAIVQQSISSSTGGIGIYDVSTTDSNVAFRIANLGTDTITGITVQLVQNTMDSVNGAIIEALPFAIDSLPPDSSISATMQYSILAIGAQPLWHATLSATTASVATVLQISGAVNLAYPTAIFQVLQPDSTAARSLLPQRNYLLKTSTEGILDSIAVLVTALPTEDVLLDSTFLLSTITSLPTTPDTLTHLHIEATVHAGNYCSSYSYYLVAGKRGESFETLSYPWHTGGTIGWAPDTTKRHSGLYSMRTGAIGDRQTSELSISVLLADYDTISYWIKTSTEPQYDKVHFYVDGVDQLPVLFGNYGWACHSYRLEPGWHLLSWQYVKDESGSSGSDCAWLDDLTLPLALWDSAYGWFPPETTEVAIPNIQTTDFSIYPNPSNGIITISGIADDMELQILDLLGRIVYSVHSPLPATLNIGFLPDGIYMLRLSTLGQVQNTKFIIKH